MNITIHAGHNGAGMKGCGAIGFLDESRCAREIVAELSKALDDAGIFFTDITVTDPELDGKRVLNTLIYSANASDKELHLSIHLNAGAGKKEKDGKTTGVEALIYPGSTSRSMAERLCQSISDTIGITNRGVKERKDLAFLRKTKSPAIILECLFVDDPDDAARYDARAIALAIAVALAEKEDTPEDGLSMCYGEWTRLYGGGYHNSHEGFIVKMKDKVVWLPHEVQEGF